MSQFKIVPKASVILHRQGVEREVPVAHRKGRLYAKHGAGWVKLCGHGQLAVKGMSWCDLTEVGGIHQPEGAYPRYVDLDLDALEGVIMIDTSPNADAAPEPTPARPGIVDGIKRALSRTKPTPT